MAALLHDIGKPFSYQDEEVRHFHGHPEVSADMTEEILKRLGYSKDFIDLAALGIVADMMSMLGYENQYIETPAVTRMSQPAFLKFYSSGFVSVTTILSK